MELVLPNHCIEINEEEVMYVDRGDGENFARNIMGLGLSVAIKKTLGIPGFAALASMSYWAVVTTFSALAGKIADITGNPIVIGIAALGGVAAVTYLWNVRVFY